MNPRWPAMMTRITAAEFCDMSPEQFDAQCPVQPIDQGWRGLRWKQTDLLKWIENLPTKPRAGLDSPGAHPANDGATGAPALTPEQRRQQSLSRF